MDDKDKKKFNYLNGAHPQYIENLYSEYKKNPDAMEYGWKKFFEGYDFQSIHSGTIRVGDSNSPQSSKEFRVMNLIDEYRRRGHLFTQTNPVRTRREYSPKLDIEYFKLSEEDLDKVFEAGKEVGLGPAPLKEIITLLKETYCKSIGAEYRFIRHPEKLKWLEKRMESTRNCPDFSSEEQKHILDKLNQAVVFESFLHNRFVGHKRFALSGGESIIPGLDAVIESGAELGVKEFVIGMPHRGRLNILANIMGKPYRKIFTEFEGKDYSSDFFIGDVKYHLGYTNKVRTRLNKDVLLNMMPNPSHLEAVDAFTQGVARSKIDHKYNGDVNKVIPIIIHGDAAIAAQGVVYEVLQMSQLQGYHTGGTIHIVINNQIGFTTDYLDGRSSTYCTDVAKVTLSPVFHVNADDVEAVVLAVRLAVEYRQTFNTDVFIDLLGYRKYGHNESDEPRFTQPKLYKVIADHLDARQIYAKKLISENKIEKIYAKNLEKKFRERLQKDKEIESTDIIDIEPPEIVDDCCRRTGSFDFESEVKTEISSNELIEIGEKIFMIPDDIDVLNKIRKLYKSRGQKLFDQASFDWAMGEAMAFGSLLNEGTFIRFSGQDSQRGTFSHRHSVLLVENTEEKFIPLNNISEKQAKFEIYNSLLSEYGVLGFEFGYASVYVDILTIWEAQFGDFSNGAQIIIDEFISSSEAKWGKLNGLVLLLPHGFEGQGPDHSSARLERLLQLCAKENMIIANCTTPANFFHLIRRQMKFPFRVPLIILTHKSLLRHPKCISDIKDFTEKSFCLVIDDSDIDSKKIQKLLLCSGKIYYELIKYREDNKIDDTAIIRLEQLYPFPKKNMDLVFEKYQNVSETLWVQEEPENMGGWTYICHKLHKNNIRHVSRRENSSPASGFYSMHIKEQNQIIEKAFGKEYSEEEFKFISYEGGKNDS